MACPVKSRLELIAQKELTKLKEELKDIAKLIVKLKEGQAKEKDK